MSAPKIIANGGVYLLNWGDEQISIQVDRIHEDSKYTVTGEMVVKTTTPGASPHLHQARVNLTSTSARRTLAGHLTERLNHLDWHGIVEQACVKVLEKHREGEPIIRLADHSVSERFSHRIEPILQEKQASVFFGQADTGKSFLAGYCGYIVAAGQAQNGFTPEPGGVLYLDYETDEDTWWERLRMISNGREMPMPQNFYYRYCHQLLAGDIQHVQRLILERDIALVIIDSAAPAVGEPESAQMTAEYFRALRSLKTTTLTIAHVSKGGKEDEPFGSIFWKNLPRANFRINASHEPGVTSFVAGLKHTKGNNSMRLKPIGIRMTFDQDSVRFDRADLIDVPELASTLSLKARIESALGKGAKTTKELAAELDTTEGTVRTKLNEWKGKSFIQVGTNLGNVQWGLLGEELL